MMSVKTSLFVKVVILFITFIHNAAVDDIFSHYIKY